MVELRQDGTQKANDIVVQVHGDALCIRRHIEIEAIEAPDTEAAHAVGQEASRKGPF